MAKTKLNVLLNDVTLTSTSLCTYVNGGTDLDNCDTLFHTEKIHVSKFFTFLQLTLRQRGHTK